MTEEVVDLFGGPGGWEIGLAALDHHDVVGVELDPSTVLTRLAAGLSTIAGDVSAIDPSSLAGATGLIASPPCQLYSNAGNRRGLVAIRALAAAVRPMLSGDDVRLAVIEAVTELLDDGPADDAQPAFDFGSAVDTAERAAARVEARHATLVLEPARWIAELHPRWIALEQVPRSLRSGRSTPRPSPSWATPPCRAS